MFICTIYLKKKKKERIKRVWGNKIQTNWYIKPPNQTLLHPYSFLHCFYSPVLLTSHQLTITCYLCVVFTNGQAVAKYLRSSGCP